MGEVKQLMGHPQHNPPLAEKDKEEEDPPGQVQTSNDFHDNFQRNLTVLQAATVRVIVVNYEVDNFKYPGDSHHHEQPEAERLQDVIQSFSKLLTDDRCTFSLEKSAGRFPSL